MPSITNQSILIIGGSSGIGFAVARLSLESGARVTIVSSNSARVTDAVQKLKESFPNGQISGHTFDINQTQLEACLETLLKEITSGGSEPLDHIIYTAGRAPALKPLTEVDATYGHDISFTTPMLVAKLALKFLKPIYTSSLIFTGGRVADKPQDHYTVYSGYAAGLIGLIRGLALEMAPLRINLVSPGATKTEMWGPQREQIAEFIGKKALLGKVGTPDEVAEAYIYLMRDCNATGSVVRSDGGALLQ